MLTEFGKHIRKIRIDRQELMKDMAEKLNVTPAYLSSVETGKRNVPQGWIGHIVRMYKLDPSEHLELIEAAKASKKIKGGK